VCVCVCCLGEANDAYYIQQKKADKRKSSIQKKEERRLEELECV